MVLRILVAEDNIFTATQYARMLEKSGHVVIITKDGQECIQKYNEEITRSDFQNMDKNPFDVVLLDNNMPKKSGVEVAKEILDKRPSQRIIFASAYDMNSLLKNPGTVPDTVEVLEKPFSLNAMLSKIQS